jgi:hypothetical protein
LGYEGQVPATGQAYVLRLVNAGSQFAQALGRDEEISVAGQDQRRYADMVKSARYIELFHEPEAMRHDALIGLPALPSDELEEGTGPLPAAEEQVEELVNEGVIRG